jgi:adenine-specific DNA-methyltransferase
LLSTVEQVRLRISKNTDAAVKSRLGQFFTPATTAAFMAGLFPPAVGGCRLLDAGAGIGSLSCAFLEKCFGPALHFDNICLTAYEFDESLLPTLHASLQGYAGKLPLAWEIAGGDFVEGALNRIQFEQDGFTHAILNPPYKKLAATPAIAGCFERQASKPSICIRLLSHSPYCSWRRADISWR